MPHSPKREPRAIAGAQAYFQRLQNYSTGPEIARNFTGSLVCPESIWFILLASGLIIIINYFAVFMRRN
jgi:hypothetical protein